MAGMEGKEGGGDGMREYLASEACEAQITSMVAAVLAPLSERLDRLTYKLERLECVSKGQPPPPAPHVSEGKESGGAGADVGNKELGGLRDPLAEPLDKDHRPGNASADSSSEAGSRSDDEEDEEDEEDEDERGGRATAFASQRARQRQNFRSQKEEVSYLRGLVMDMERRLSNARFAQEAQELIAARAAVAQREAETRALNVGNALDLLLDQKQAKDRKESIARIGEEFEATKQEIAKRRDEVRMARMDQMMLSGGTVGRPSRREERLQAELKKLVVRHDSQKDMLSQLNALQATQEQLVTAATNGDLAMVKELVHASVSVNYVDEAGYQPLHYACGKGHLEVAEILLEAGASVNGEGSAIPPVALTAQEGFVDLAKLLVDNHADVNRGTPEGVTPLMVAVQRENIEVCELLLSVGAFVDTPDKKGNTALHRASRGQSAATVELLLLHGADAHRPNVDGVTPRQHAFRIRIPHVMEEFARWTGEETNMAAALTEPGAGQVEAL